MNFAMLQVPTDMYIFSCVLLVLYMPVATRKPLYYSSIICNADVYIDTINSPLYIRNIYVPVTSTPCILAHGDAYESSIHICNNCNIVHVIVCVLVTSSLDESIACVTQYGYP